METMTTTETNILIAEFMGAMGTPKYNPTEWDIYITGCLDVDSDDENAQHFYVPNEMKYNTSWDWLMPVVEKIKDMGYDQELDKIDNVLACDLRRDRLYNEVVEFIKWYNQQKDLPDTM